MGNTSLFWALGIVGVVFGLLNFLMGIFGGFFDPLWIGGNFLVGLLLLLYAGVTNLDALRERMRSGEARRAGKYGSSALVSTLLVIAILGGLGFLASRYHKRFDWSEQQVHSLTDQSRKVLAALDHDVEVTAFYPPLSDTEARELLDRYAYESDLFAVTYADPNERPDLLAGAGVTQEDLGDGLVRIALGGEAVTVRELTEEKVTNALVKLTRTGEKTVYFLEGHNERAIEGEGGAERNGFQRAADALRNENYSVQKLLLAAAGDVPDDADVVVAAGATRPLLAVEREALERYTERGGAVLLLLDPRAQTDLVDVARAWGVDVGDDVIVDRALALFGRATSPFAESYAPDHDITRDLREPALFHMVRSIRGGNGPGFTELVLTGDSSWAERDLEQFFGEGTAELGDGDVAGPVSVAVAGTLPAVAAAANGAAEPAEGGAEDAADESGADASGARVAVFGDVDFASNELLEAYRNRDLFLNTVNWLMGDVEAISVRPRLSRASRFQLTQEQFRRITNLSLFVLPEALAVIGVFVWWSRRSAPARSSR